MSLDAFRHVQLHRRGLSCLLSVRGRLHWDHVTSEMLTLGRLALHAHGGKYRDASSKPRRVDTRTVLYVRASRRIDIWSLALAVKRWRR